MGKKIGGRAINLFYLELYVEKNGVKLIIKDHLCRDVIVAMQIGQVITFIPPFPLQILLHKSSRF